MEIVVHTVVGKVLNATITATNADEIIEALRALEQFLKEDE